MTPQVASIIAHTYGQSPRLPIALFNCSMLNDVFVIMCERNGRYHKKNIQYLLLKAVVIESVAKAQWLRQLNSWMLPDSTSAEINPVMQKKTSTLAAMNQTVCH